jgi:hypothetical protein
MAIQTETDSEPKVTTLLSGILEDARHLLAQQLTLFQVEIKNDFRHAISAFLPLMAGGAVFLVALLILAFGAAHFISWRFTLPTWAGFAIVGGVIAVIGLVLLIWGKMKLDTFNPLPEKSMEGLKENIQWKTKK